MFVGQTKPLTFLRVICAVHCFAVGRELCFAFGAEGRVLHLPLSCVIRARDRYKHHRCGLFF